MNPNEPDYRPASESFDDQVLLDTIALRKTLSEVLTLLRTNRADAITNSLTTIMSFFSVDRVFIGYFGQSKNKIIFIHEAYAEGTGKMPDLFYDRLSSHDLPWWTDKVWKDEVICINDTTIMPSGAYIEQTLMRQLCIDSQLAVPTYYNGVINGFIGLDCVNRKREWNALDIENLRMFSDLLSMAIEQARTKVELEQSSHEAFKSEAKFRIIFEKLPMGVEVYDKDGILIDINQADMDIFGITREKALGVNMFDNPNIPEEAKEKARRGEEADMAMNYSFDIGKEKGYYEWGEEKKGIKYIRAKCTPVEDLDGMLQGYLFLVVDDTENHLKTEQIQSSYAKLQLAVDTGDAYIWDFDLETGELNVDFSINDSPLKQMDLSNDWYVNGSSAFIQTIHPDDYEKVITNGFQRIVDGEIDNFTTNFRRIHEGKITWYNTNIRTYKYNAEGKPARIVSYMVNITEQQEKEIELIKIKEADKLKSAFLANMSHEIRTPLNAIVGFSNVLGDMHRTPDTEELVGYINANNELLLQLVSDILDFSEIEAGMLHHKKEEIDIKEICKEILSEQRSKVPPGLDLVFDADAPSVILQTDGKRVKQVIESFLSNAFKFTEKGLVRLEYKITPGNELCVKVSDTGIGLSEKNKQQIFNTFFKVDTFKQGVGLGLTISKILIELLGGTIGVESNEGEGSVFWFSLPLS